MDYWIERDAQYKRVNHKNGKVSHQCPVKVKFYMIDEAGEEVNLSGAARFNSQYGGGTNEEIKKVLGTFDDFILNLIIATNQWYELPWQETIREKKNSFYFYGYWGVWTIGIHR